MTEGQEASGQPVPVQEVAPSCKTFRDAAQLLWAVGVDTAATLGQVSLGHILS
jgi:hypothetical protein